MPFSGEKIIYKATCSSTNTVAMQLISTQVIPAGTIVITDHQLEGRGQRGNSWISEPYKNLTFSLILYPTWLTTKQSFLLTIITTMGIYDVLKSFIPNGLSIKWPNDIYYQNKKIGGVLIENLINRDKLKASVIGIGLNVNQINFSLPTASSLALVCKCEFNLSSLLSQLVDSIQAKYDQLCKENIHTCKVKYLQNLYWIHQHRTFLDREGYFQGFIQGIDEIGRLVVFKENNEINYYNVKEITFVK